MPFGCEWDSKRTVERDVHESHHVCRSAERRAGVTVEHVAADGGKFDERGHHGKRVF